MTDPDIVTKLRGFRSTVPETDFVQSLMIQAADEIVKLREMLAKKPVKAPNTLPRVDEENRK